MVENQDLDLGLGKILMELDFITTLDLVGAAAFAISGALAAMDRKLDLFGIIIVAFVTAIGGGTLRDILIGTTPVNWMSNLYYLYFVGAIIVLAIIFRNKLNQEKGALELFDAVGLGAFTIIGVELGLAEGLSPLISIILGTMTGTFGGVLRDILCNEIPVIFHKEIYATASLSGGLLYVLLYWLHVPFEVIHVSTTLLIICIRFLAIRFHISLPTFHLKSKEKH